MSRFSHIRNGHEFAWGFDHACGWFVQVFDMSADNPDEDLVVDQDSLFDGIDLEDVLRYASEYEVLDEVQKIVEGM